MASVKSIVRDIVKPIAYWLLGKRFYFELQVKAKIKDIQGSLVEEKEMELLPRLVKPGDSVLDIGANYAYYTVRLSKLVKEKGLVYAFEPIPFTYQVAEKVLEYFKVSNVKLYSKGVGERNEKTDFQVPLQSFGAISAGQAHIGSRNNEKVRKAGEYSFQKHKKITAEIVALDSFLPTVTNITFVKIDIEGAELFALRGMRRLIEKNLPVILIEICPHFLIGFNIEESTLYQEVKAMGYDFFLYEHGKLKQVTLPFTESNHILLPVSKLENYADLLY